MGNTLHVGEDFATRWKTAATHVAMIQKYVKRSVQRAYGPSSVCLLNTGQSSENAHGSEDECKRHIGSSGRCLTQQSGVPNLMDEVLEDEEDEMPYPGRL